MRANPKIVPANFFYDAIAKEYDSRLTTADSEVRAFVSQVFRHFVPSGQVLDFGGGTGLDLPWLLGNGYEVFFVEPSVNMRREAALQALKFPDARCMMAEQRTSIAQWQADQLPFCEKMDGVLANFAVLNCLANLEEVFEKLSLVMKQNGYLLATVLDNGLPGDFMNYPMSVLRGFFKNKKVTYSNYQGTGHETYIHSLRDFKRTAAPFFNFHSCSPIGASKFSLLMLKKK